MAQTKELVEVLEGLEVLSEVMGKVFADDKVTLGDAKFALDLVEKKEVLIEAFKGIDEIDDEVKDLDAEEIKVVVDKVFDIVSAFKKGKKEA